MKSETKKGTRGKISKPRKAREYRMRAQFSRHPRKIKTRAQSSWCVVRNPGGRRGVRVRARYLRQRRARSKSKDKLSQARSQCSRCSQPADASFPLLVSFTVSCVTCAGLCRPVRMPPRRNFPRPIHHAIQWSVCSAALIQSTDLKSEDRRGMSTADKPIQASIFLF